MNLNFSELHSSCEYLRSLFILNESWRFGKIQKIFSSAKIIVLNIRVPGKTIYLGIGRGNDFCGTWALEKNIPSTHRIVKDRLLEYLRSNVSGKNVIDLSCDEKDRCIKITMHDKSELLFFWKGRRLHFSHTYYKDGIQYSFSPWENLSVGEAIESGFDIFDKIDRKELELKQCREDFLTPDYEKLFAKGKLSSKKIKKSERKIKLIEGDLARCRLWKELQADAIEDKLDLSNKTLKWKSFKVKFDPSLTHFQRRDLVFFKIKKLKKGESILANRLEEAKTELLSQTPSDSKVEEAIVFPIWSEQKKIREKTATRKEGSVFYEWNNIKIAIGTTAQANDDLRKSWSKKDDYWFHLDGYKSAHLFVKGDEQLSYENIQVFSSILANHSGFEAEMIPIIYTKVGNLKGIKGIAGTVNYKKEKHLLVQRVNWKEIISTSW